MVMKLPLRAKRLNDVRTRHTISLCDDGEVHTYKHTNYLFNRMPVLLWVAGRVCAS